MSDVITVTGVSTPVTIYGTYAAAKDYIAVMFGDAYSAWTALSPDDQKRSLIAATRFLEAQSWDATTAGSFAVRDALAVFGQASYELAVAIVDDPAILGGASSVAPIRGIGSGSDRVDYFTPPATSDGPGSQFPPVVARLIAQYLAAATSSIGGGIVSGTDGVSAFDVDDDNGNDINPFARSWPLE